MTGPFESKRHVVDEGIPEAEARDALRRHKAGEITEDDFWWLLGVDFYRHQRIDLFSPEREEQVTGVLYLVANKAHIWDGTDTLCKSYKNGTIQADTSRDIHATTLGRPVCKNCLSHA